MTTKKQDWHDRIVDLAMQMGRERHIGPRRGLSIASCWAHRACDRIRDNRDVHTGEFLPKKRITQKDGAK